MSKTKKSRFIDKIESLSKEDKLYAINFFTRYPQYEKHIDWNRSKSLRDKDFEQVFKMAENSKRSLKHKTKSDPRLLFEKYNCEIITQTDDILIVIPYDWECAVFFNSFACGGEGARWCIGEKEDPKVWYNYRFNENIFALLFFIKRHPVFGKKILLQYKPEIEDFIFWNQNDEPIIDIEDHYESLYDNRENENQPPYKILPDIWYSHLLIEKEISKQLFFEFDIFLGINTEEICDLLNKILKKNEFSSSLQNAYKIIAQECETLLKKIHKEYYIKGSVLVGYYNNQASEAVIPSDITSIGDGAFDCCYNLRSIVIPDRVASIGVGTFYSCRNLTSITIPNSVTSIGERAFKGCEKLTSISIPDSITSIGDSAFDCCSSLTSIIIPSSVTAIGKYTFEDCGSLTSVTIPDSVTSIGERAFKGCEKLTSVTIPDSVTSIGEGAFCFCENLTSVTIPNSVTSIGEGTFDGCKKTK